MAITRINNNQITDSVLGNAFVGVNAATKIQDFTITAGKIQNNLTYGSDLTITGNLTVQGTTTAAALVMINGVVQLPITAYSVSGNTLTFTQAPVVSDTIDIRFL